MMVSYPAVIDDLTTPSKITSRLIPAFVTYSACSSVHVKRAGRHDEGSAAALLGTNEGSAAALLGSDEGSAAALLGTG